MKKACIIAAYFGEFPELFPGWLMSVKYNTELDFLLVTDQKVEGKSLPSNLKVIKMSLLEMRNLAAKELKIENLVLDRPYKCCDFKPVYGLIFKDYVVEYEFVGNCDLDMVFGDLSKYLTDDIWNNYDKILPLGHLAFYRNTKEVLEYYKLKADVFADYMKSFTEEQICVFDEEAGINNIYRQNGLRLYDKYLMADISEKNSRLKLTQLSLSKNEEFVNYNYQIFYYENGKIMRSYIDKDGNIGQDEFIYLHAKKRHFNVDGINNIQNNSFYFLSDRIECKEEKEINKEIIMKYSEYVSERYDRMEMIRYNTKNLFRKGKIKCKKTMKRWLQS